MVSRLKWAGQMERMGGLAKKANTQSGGVEEAGKTAV